jgi:hypothetical protein
VDWEAIAYVVSLAFAAGAFYAREVRHKKQLDGLGRKLVQTQARDRRRYIHFICVLIRYVPEIDKASVVELLRRDVEPDLETYEIPLNDQDEREHYRDR